MTTGKLYHCRAFPPEKVTDTVGAGDVFNAAVIDGFLSGMGFSDILEHANKIAGKKCGNNGIVF